MPNAISDMESISRQIPVKRETNQLLGGQGVIARRVGANWGCVVVRFRQEIGLGGSVEASTLADVTTSTRDALATEP